MPMLNQGYSLLWLILSPRSVQQSLTPLLAMCRSPFSCAISKSSQFVKWNNFQNYLTRCKQLRFDTLQCLTKQETGDKSLLN